MSGLKNIACLSIKIYSIETTIFLPFLQASDEHLENDGWWDKFVSEYLWLCVGSIAANSSLSRKTQAQTQKGDHTSSNFTTCCGEPLLQMTDFAFCWQSKVVWESIATLYYLKLAWIVERKRVDSFTTWYFCGFCFLYFTAQVIHCWRRKHWYFLQELLSIGSFYPRIVPRTVKSSTRPFLKMDVRVCTAINPL